MKPKRLVVRTLQAMGLGLLLAFALLLTGIAIEMLGNNPTWDKSLVSLGYASIIGLYATFYAMIGWVVVIWPLTYVSGIDRLLGHIYFTEVIWILFALLAFGVVIASWAGSDAWLIAWMPAVVGLCVGLSYRWLLRKEAKT